MKTKDEIKRRFLTLETSWKERAKVKLATHIIQGYPVHLQQPGVAVRVRKSISFIGNIKYEYGEKHEGTELITPEAERIIPEKDGIVLLSDCEDNILNKIRWRVKIGKKLTVEVDEFISIRNEPVILTISEVEFKSTEDAEAFEPPTWFGKEITAEFKWSNYQLCTEGIPFI